MATVETIQASGGDFTSIQAWFDDKSPTAGTDITSDSNAPYIGELAAETFTGMTWINDTVCDATHYLHLRPQSGKWFEGDFGDTNHPILENDDGTSSTLFVTSTSYFRCEGIQIQNLATNTSVVDARDGVGVYFNRCGIGPTDYTTNSTVTYKVFNWRAVSNASHTLIITNCTWGGISKEQSSTNKGGTEAGLYINTIGNVYVYNCVFHDFDVTYSSQGTGVEFIHWIVCYDGTVNLKNCVFGTITCDAANQTISTFSGSGTFSASHNATVESSTPSVGTNWQTGITMADEIADATWPCDLHLKTGGDCDGNGTNLVSASAANAPTEDIDGETRPATGSWAIGCDYVEPSSSSDVLPQSLSHIEAGEGASRAMHTIEQGFIA